MHPPQSPTPTPVPPVLPPGENSGKIDWRTKAKCLGLDPRLWDLDSEAWAGHPLALKPRAMRATVLCKDCPVRKECALFALTETPRMLGVVLAGVDIPVAGGAKARAAKKLLREVAYG